MRSDLTAFANEAYFYNATVAYIAWPTRPRNASFMSHHPGDGDEIYPIALCATLAKQTCPGWLCGVAHHIIEYVWSVAALSEMIEREGEDLRMLSEDSLSEYRRLDSLFRLWQPPRETQANYPDHCRVAQLYRQAGIVYLHRVVHPFSDSATDGVVQAALQSFLGILTAAAPGSALPTLPWSFVMIGSCLTDNHSRQILTRYMHSSYDSSRMVNMGQTIRFLAKLWWVRDYDEEGEDGDGNGDETTPALTSRCSGDFHYVMRALKRWNTLMS
jgi:hypothetical protein